MLKTLFLGAVNDLLGRETLKSEVYGFRLSNVVGHDSVNGQFYLEATPHLLDKTKYALAEVVINHTSSRLTPPDLAKMMVKNTTTTHNPVKDEDGNTYALTRDEALKKIAEYQADKDKQCLNSNSQHVSFHKISTAQQKPDALAL